MFLNGGLWLLNLRFRVIVMLAGIIRLYDSGWRGLLFIRDRGMEAQKEEKLTKEEIRHYVKICKDSGVDCAVKNSSENKKRLSK